MRFGIQSDKLRMAGVGRAGNAALSDAGVVLLLELAYVQVMQVDALCGEDRSASQRDW